MREQGRRGDKYTCNSLCEEASVERTGPRRHVPGWPGVHVTSESGCSHKARENCGGVISQGPVSNPGPILGPKEGSRQAESGHFSFSPGGLGGRLEAWLLPEASAIF